MLIGEIGVSGLGGNHYKGESNETKMTENEAFLAYCQNDGDDSDD